MSFFNRLIKNIKIAAVIFVILATLGSIIYTLRLLRKSSDKPTFSAIIDTDSGNGVDNMFAVARALADPGFELIGLTSSQWNYYPDLTDSTAVKGREINDTLLQLFRRYNIPSHQGGEEMIYYSKRQPLRCSEASEFIIRKAHEVPKKVKLNIIALGGLTNIAEAILLDSTILPKIRIYSHVMIYNRGKKVWNKNEANARSDLDALDIVLNSEGTDLHIMPASSSRMLVFNKTEIYDLMRFKGPQWDYLLKKWDEHFPGENEITMSDVALIEAVLNEEFTKKEQTVNPPENSRKTIIVYSWINNEFMKIDYWKVIKNYISDRSRQRF